MAGRIRTFKPELLEDPATAGLSDGAFRLLWGMMLQADDHGNLRVHPTQLAGAVFWARPKSSAEVADLLDELTAASMIRCYRARGLTCAHLVGWKEKGHVRHQRVDHPSDPRVPTPDDEEAQELPPFGHFLANVSRESRESLAPDLRPPTSDLRSRSRPADPRPALPADGQSLALITEPPKPKFDFEVLYKRYPRKEGKSRGLKVCKREVRTQADYEALGKAIDEYARRVAGKSEDYVKYFSTFMGEWRDYLEPAAGEAVDEGLRATRQLMALVDR